MECFLLNKSKNMFCGAVKIQVFIFQSFRFVSGIFLFENLIGKLSKKSNITPFFTSDLKRKIMVMFNHILFIRNRKEKKAK